MFVENDLVKKLQHIRKATNAEVVLSSTWRIGWYELAAGIRDSHNIDDYRALVEKLLSYGIPIHGHTPILYGHTRGEEITYYLKRAKDVEAFLILDDITVEGYAERQITTNPKTGLTDDQVKAAIFLLNK